MTDLTVWEMRKADMWCVMRVRVGSEESVRLQCQKKLSSDLLKGCYVFYYQEKKHIQGEWVIRENILFPGYVFMVTEQADRLSDELIRIKGFAKLLEAGSEVAALTEDEVDFLTVFGGKEQTVEMSEGVIEQSRIRVYSGPLVGKERYISRIDRHKRRAYLEMPMFGERQKVRVGLEIVSKS